MYNDSYAYKVAQLTSMRDYERKQTTNQQYGAQLSHWSGSAGKPIQLDADALQALIDHYNRLDSVERYRAAKQAAKADSDGEKEYQYCVDTYACSSFTVMAKDAEEAEEKAQSFIDSDDFFTLYRAECDFFEPTVDYIQANE